MIIHMHIMMIGVGQGGWGGRGRGGAGASNRQMRPKGIYCLRQSGWGGWAFLVSSGTIYIYLPLFIHFIKGFDILFFVVY